MRGQCCVANVFFFFFVYIDWGFYRFDLVGSCGPGGLLLDLCGLEDGSYCGMGDGKEEEDECTVLY